MLRGIGGKLVVAVLIYLVSITSNVLADRGRTGSATVQNPRR